jgi:hypothetical protein
MPRLPSFPVIIAALCSWTVAAFGQVVISEIQYHPVERPSFNLDGTPKIDLSDDVHEFVEIHNTGAADVDLSNWKITGGIGFTFPAGTTIPTGGFRVIPKDPARIATVYGLAAPTLVTGPGGGGFSGKLSNNGDNLNLIDANGSVVDAASYQPGFPWATSADALAAGKDFTGIPYISVQYKGRSLQRVSFTTPGNDPSNWVASPLPLGPTPGASNAEVRDTPKPIVTSITAVQTSDESSVIRASQPVRVSVQFSSTVSLSEVQLEYFVDDINSFIEPRATVAMTDLGNGAFETATPLPGFANRTIVRYRIKANRGSGLETVSPRPDDVAIVPVSSTLKEAWHSYFVQPVRGSTKPAYDFFISASNITRLNNNINQSPRRVTTPDPPGYPRNEPFEGYYPGSNNFNPANYPAPTAPNWDGVVPAVFVKDGIVYDVVARYHGSRYQRAESKNSWKIFFPRTQLFENKQRILLTEKGNETVIGYGLYHEANLPAAYSRMVDFFKNSDPVINRCEITDADEETIEQFQREYDARFPQTAPNFSGRGIIYKAKGLDGDEGPYGWANGQPMPVRSVWIPLHRYVWSYPIQNDDWKGHAPFKSMLDALWAARGDASRLTYPNIYGGQDHNNLVAVTANLTNLRAYLSANWDVDQTLTFLAIRNWCSPWDDKFHNYYVYQLPNGKWTMLPWDFDFEMMGSDPNTASPTNSIFAGRKNDTASYSNNFRGPNWFKDSLLRAFEAEYKQRLFTLNNTLLLPANVQAVAVANGVTVPDSGWLTNRFNSVNSQVGLGTFRQPAKPSNVTPVADGSVIPSANLVGSAYAHPAGRPHARTRWEIREESGTYKAPVYHVVSSTNLTSLPIPFELLTFGSRYFWRITYFDADDHPSLASNETAFVFGSTPPLTPLIAYDATWKLNIVDQFTNSSWTAPGFDDTGANWQNAQTLVADVGDPATVEPIRTVINLDTNGDTVNDRMTLYFRTRFNFPGTPLGATIRMQYVIDDGAVFYVNGQEVTGRRFNMPAGSVTYNTPASSSVNPAYSSLVTIPASYFVPGENTIAVEVHQVLASNNDIYFGLKLEGKIPYLAGDISFNEICADNQNVVSNGGSHPDYIEIYNRTFQNIDISTWSLSDDVLAPGKFVFPAGTSVPAQGYLVVWCDNDTAAPGLHTGFGLGKSGQTLALFQGSTVRDTITFGPQARNYPIGRATDGSDTWTLVNPSPNAPNSAVTLGSAASLRFNEWMAAPLSGEDWFEIYNTDANPVALGGLWLSDTSGQAITQIPPFSFTEGRGFVVFVADGTTGGGNHCNFKLGTGGDNLILLQTNGSTVITSRTFGLQQPGVSQGLLPDGATNVTSFPLSPTPEASNYLPAAVVINEALTNSAAPFEDAIELRNTSSTAVNIGGWWLSDDQSNLQKFQFPPETTIPPNGYLVIYENQFNTGPNAFSLSSLGDEIVLSAVGGGGELTGLRSQVKFGSAAENVSFGRVNVAGGADFWPLVSRSFGMDNPATTEEFRTGTGAANGLPRIGPIIVNEVMYHPPDLNGADNSRDEYVEIQNVTPGPLDIGGWRLKGDSDYDFPAGTVLDSGEYALIVSFDPADTATRDAFRLRYGLGDTTRILGPYLPKLSNSTNSVEIAYPGPLTGGEIAWINVEKLEYRDSAPWVTQPDGDGPSLQRMSRAVIGNDPSNWIAANPSPGAVNPGQLPFDLITQPPVLVAPVSDAVTGRAINISFTFPEKPLSGSPKLSFVNDGNSRYLSLASAVQTAGTHTFNLDPEDPDAAAEITGIAGGPTIPDGVYTVTIGYQDQYGNPGASASSTNVRVDTIAPVVSVPENITVQATGENGAVVVYEPTATDVGGSGVVSLESTPASGSTLPIGETIVTATATDMAGNVGTANFTVTVRSGEIASTVRFSKGDLVPGAGTPGGPPSGAVFASFGEPAINDSGLVAVLGRWTSAAGPGSGIVTDDECIARVGGAVPGLPGVTFRTLLDPVISGGRIAFLSTLRGEPMARSAAVVSNAPGGVLGVVARAGDPAPGANGAAFKRFRTVVTEGDRLAILAELAIGTGAPNVTAATDIGLWVKDGTHGLTRVLQEGQIVGGRVIKTLTAFRGGAGSPGQGRGWLLAPNGVSQVIAHVSFTDRTQAVLAADTDGVVTVLSDTVGTFGAPSIVGAGFQGFGLPAINDAGESTFVGSLKLGLGGVSNANAQGIFERDGNQLYAPVVRTNEIAGTTGSIFSVVKDPVLAEDGGLAFAATLQGGTARGPAAKSIWWRPADGELGMLARGGTTVADLPGAQWRSFDSLAILNTRGPIFTGSLVAGRAGVNKATAAGVWATDLNKSLRLLFRAGDLIGGRKLKSFGILKAVPGATGMTRSFNNSAHVAWRATFVDKTTAIVVTEIP